MSNYSYLVKDYGIFKLEIENLIAVGNTLLTKPVEHDGEFESFVKEKKQWEDQVQAVLKESFASPTNEFVNEFYSVHAESSFYRTEIGTTRPVSVRGKDLKETIKEKIKYLIYNLRLISLCEYIKLGDKFDLEKRQKYKSKEKVELLLDKLYQLDDGSYHPVEMLLEGNGVKLKSSMEPRELVEFLQSKGHIESLGGLGVGVSARITTQGSMYIEEQTIPYTEDYNDIPSEQDEVSRKVDEIIETLKKHNIGQEILFDELQELKTLYEKLNKKNWGQILKGKLVDLALGKLVENETIQFIYEKLTGNELKLLK